MYYTRLDSSSGRPNAWPVKSRAWYTRGTACQWVSVSQITVARINGLAMNLRARETSVAGPRARGCRRHNDGSNEGHGTRTQVADHQRRHYPSSAGRRRARSSTPPFPYPPLPAVCFPYVQRGSFVRFFFPGSSVVSSPSRITDAYAGSPLRPWLLVVLATFSSSGLSDSFLFFLFFSRLFYFYSCFPCSYSFLITGGFFFFFFFYRAFFFPSSC